MASHGARRRGLILRTHDPTNCCPGCTGVCFSTLEYAAETVTLFTAGVLGDYNLNGVVDAADYTVWRNTLGQVADGLAADGNASGTIDAGDYDVWKSTSAKRPAVAAAPRVILSWYPNHTPVSWFSWHSFSQSNRGDTQR